MSANTSSTAHLFTHFEVILFNNFTIFLDKSTQHSSAYFFIAIETSVPAENSSQLIILRTLCFFYLRHVVLN